MREEEKEGQMDNDMTIQMTNLITKLNISFNTLQNANGKKYTELLKFNFLIFSYYHRLRLKS